MDNNCGKDPGNLENKEQNIVLEPANPQTEPNPYDFPGLNMEPAPIAVSFEEDDLEDSADSKFFDVVFEIIGDFFLKNIQK
jgi:hypothetical protein